MTDSTFKPALWTRGDWNAFFGFGTNILVNMLVLTGLLRFVLKMPDSLVFGRILPALGLMMCLSTFYYAWLAYRLAQKTGRDDVAALPSGVSVPHMFIVTFVIMLPILLKTNDPIKAWEAGTTWVFIQSFILMIGGFIAPYVRKITPRAALLGTLAGVSIAFISMKPALDMYLTPVIGITCFAIIMVSWFGGVRYPMGVPAGLVAIVVGTAIAWGSNIFGLHYGGMSGAALWASIKSIHVSLPVPAGWHTFGGFEYIGAILVTAIPFGVYDLVEAMDNVESAEAAGDAYPTTRVLTADGVVSCIGALMGNPFINAVYIGHPGWKAMGGRIGYSAATGVMVIVLSCFGIISLLLDVVPVVAISPILLYIGMLIGAQAFQTTPKSSCAGGGAGAHPASCRLGQDADRRRAHRRRHQRRQARHRQARRRRRDVSGPRSAGRRLDPRRPHARGYRGVRDRARFHEGFCVFFCRRGDDLFRLHARLGGRHRQRRPRRHAGRGVRLPDRRGVPVRARQEAGLHGGAGRSAERGAGRIARGRCAASDYCAQGAALSPNRAAPLLPCWGPD